MSGHMDWGELFLSANGRLARAPFLVAAAVLFGIAWIYEAIVGETNTLHWLTGFFVYPALFYCGACVLSKRLHDRGRSGWIAALILVALVATWPMPIYFFDFVFMLVVIWAVIELGVMSGEQGANRFGPNPLRAVAV
ncbi:MAG TPA: DUF805 domain-containing protein [Phenylobacterium sp.]|nr:DUF805 domain-containing protein [Phenylobacterium sp.]